MSPPSGEAADWGWPEADWERNTPGALPNRLWRLYSSANVAGSAGHLGNVGLTEVGGVPATDAHRDNGFFAGLPSRERSSNDMRWIAASTVAGMVLMGASATAGTAAPPEPLIVYGTCSVCHGHDGISARASFPDLAAQTKTYLDAELKDFRDHTRADHDAKAYMWNMAGNMSAKLINEVAQYFSALTPPKGATGEDPAGVTAGRQIFEQGINSENVPACQACHGAKAAGSDTFPRVAGQHREYLVAQLKAFRSNERDNPTMHLIVGQVTDEQIRDVAAYLASL